MSETNKNEEVCYHPEAYSLELDRVAEDFVRKMLYVFLAIALLEPFVFGVLTILASSQ